MLPQFTAEIQLRCIIAMRVGCLVEPDIVFCSCGQAALHTNFVFVLRFGEQGAGPVGAFLVHSPDKRRLKITISARGVFPSANPFVFRFLYIGIVSNNHIEGILKGEVQRILSLDNDRRQE